MLNYIFNLFKKEPTPGLLEDKRTFDERLKDYKFEEIVGTPDQVTWQEKKPNEWKSFSVRDQSSSSSCVMQAIAKTAEVLYKEEIPFSAGFYRYRVNNSPGMYMHDGFNIWRDRGICTEDLLPSQNLSESQMNNLKITRVHEEVAKSFRVGNYVQFTPKISFDEVASTIQKTGKSITLTFVFDRNEWTDIPTVKGFYAPLGHAVSAVDTTLYKGKQYLVIEDSWGIFNSWNGKRLISREFYEARNTSAYYPINFKLLAQETEVKHHFSRTLNFGQTSDDIKYLQDILKKEGLFPLNVESTGYYGAITAKGVYDWQVKHKVAPLSELNSLQGRSVGAKTIAKLNEIYA